jgi:hypothetical protein
MIMARCRPVTWPAAGSSSIQYAGLNIMVAQIQKEKFTSSKQQAASHKQQAASLTKRNKGL